MTVGEIKPVNKSYFARSARYLSQVTIRQLQHLFHLHDSGLDRALIDALPIFYYEDIIMGLKEPFDCAVCLSEFSGGDKLKFLPNCSHAFHIHCIETWLLSNSTCPLCRSLIGFFDDPMGQCNISSPQGANQSFSQENDRLVRIFSIRLGKFKNSNEGLGCKDISSGSIDARRCYSMGAFQYIVDNADVKVALCRGNVADGANVKARCTTEQFSSNAETEGKKIDFRSRGDSFSVSKIWLWSKKGKFSSSFDVNDSVVLPMPNGSNLV
ncbi:hypothetical protein DH2020_042897 [Rehmannia glutinosa]|uniref:RING-type domain-containing protein n=1 Tax=Rehmannia glutinosa TaxID=99300 RepID=A0ABR0UM46_REHGL